jgi:cellulose synthase/poly-beta-1,6-N-acetylglucosamine synthase-like glycosyltransferase
MRIGELLVSKGLITREHLEEALEYQKRYGGRLGWILASLGYVRRLDLFKTLAEHLGLEFLDNLEDAKKLIDYKFLTNFDPYELAGYETIPARQTDKEVILLTSDPESNRFNAFVQKYFPNRDRRVMVLTDLDLVRLLEFGFKRKFIDRAVHGLFYMSPEYSASVVFSRWQVLAMGIFLYLSVIFIYYDVTSYLVGLILIIQIFYILSILFKLIVSLAGVKSEMEQFVTDEEVKGLDERDLPVYTVLVPVYKESEVISTLVNNLKKMDYPSHKLDVILLMEEDDWETYEAAKAQRPPANWRFIVVPSSLPRTKPKACNYGLSFARGRYLTIYDAEDVPEPDQLKKAVIAFRKGGERYICFQAQLNYFNKKENFLTKMFTLEYSYWFDYLLPGLYNLRLPIPLGGTSNHFDVEKLKEVGAWDPFNTTEDADLGVRAFGSGYRVGVINSTTYEEANAKVGNWIRQRSRWIKGYMQTWLVHVRNSRRLYKSVGLRGFVAFHLLIGGTPFTFLVNPIMWMLFILWLTTQTKVLDVFFPPGVLYISLFNLLFGNFLGIYLNMLAVFRRKYYDLLPYALLNPVYWILHSIAAYRALYELFTKPFYWPKTQHGITKYKPPLLEGTR